MTYGDQETYLGVDLTSSEKKPSAYAVLDQRPSVVELGYLLTDDEVLHAAGRHHTWAVGIDSPIGVPSGQCCLEESCSCQSTWEFSGRLCERELSKRGIGCFYTTKRSIIKAMVYRAVALTSMLSGDGHRVLEIFPYASKVRLFGRPIPSKMRAEGLAFLKERLLNKVGGLQSHLNCLDHDLCDALVVAYTAYLHSLGQTEVLGIPEEGQIVIPRLPCGG